MGDYETICVYCCSNKDLVSKEDCYPQCSAYKQDPESRLIFVLGWCMYFCKVVCVCLCFIFDCHLYRI